MIDLNLDDEIKRAIINTCSHLVLKMHCLQSILLKEHRICNENLSINSALASKNQPEKSDEGKISADDS